MGCYELPDPIKGGGFVTNLSNGQLSGGDCATGNHLKEARSVSTQICADYFGGNPPGKETRKKARRILADSS